MTVEPNFVWEWGTEHGGTLPNLRGASLKDTTDCRLNGLKLTSAFPKDTVSHLFLEDCADIVVNGGWALNDSGDEHRAALNNNGTTARTINNGFEPRLGAGASWAIAGALENPIQNGSVTKGSQEAGAVVSAATGADITLDASKGQGSFFLDAGATSVVQILPHHKGQRLTLQAAGNVTLKNTNIYTAGGSDFAMTANDTVTLICVVVNGASSTWAEVSRSVN